MPYKPIVLPGKLAVMSLDLEEDHAGLSDDLRYEAVAQLPEIVGWFEKNKIPLSIFVAGNFLEKSGRSLEGIVSPQFHCHGYWHPPHHRMWEDDLRHGNIRDGIKAFETFFKRKPEGYRAGCGILKEEDLPLLKAAGVKFDSSFFTGFHVSGFHLFRSSRPRWYPSMNFMEIPISAHPFFRLPMGMAYMKLMGPALFSFPQRLGLGMRPLVFDFHLHDLMETSILKGFSPFWKWIYSRGNARPALHEWVLKLKDQGVEFVGINELYQRLNAAKI